MRFTPTVALFGVVLPTLSFAGRKGRVGKQGMLMPDLSKVLGDAWTVPPELSDRARPGSVLELTEAGLRVVMPDCVAMAPSESSLTNVSMQNSLSGGVGWGEGRVGASASAEHTMKLTFQGPTVQGFYLIDFVPSPACVSKLTAYAERGGDLSKMVVVQEALMARVSGCEQSTASAGLSGPGGGASLSGAGACQMFSDAPVVVGLKTVALSDFPELARAAELDGGSSQQQSPTLRMDGLQLPVLEFYTATTLREYGGVVVTVTPDAIAVDGRPLHLLRDGVVAKDDARGSFLPRLHGDMNGRAEEASKDAPDGMAFKGRATIVADASVPAETMRMVLYTLGQA